MIDKYKGIYHEMEIIEAIKPHISSLDLSKPYENIIQTLVKKTKFTEDDIKSVVSKYNIKSLLTIVTDKSKYQQLLTEYQDNLRNIDSYITNYISEIDL